MNAPKGEETIFAEALRLPPEERAAYVAQSTSGNHELRREVESLLQSYEAGEFLEAPAAPELRQTLLTAPLSEKPGDRIGRYKLLQQIGEGGCGVVYMAEQEEPVRRRVALKIIKLGMDTKSVIARFEAERQALALMDHPNIAKVFDAGSTERPLTPSLSPDGGEGARRAGEGDATLSAGRPYFVMELVRGMKITDYCDEAKLSTHARLDLFIQVCQAIQHAHQKGIIHRDIKPSNILVSANDGVLVPKVIDFGIAKATSGQKLTDKTLFTAFEQFIGTPAYMSPEQAVITNVDIDTRSDIYALGVLLYELLTGRTPFDAKELLAIGLDEMRRTIREQEPPRPSTRLSTLSGQELSTTAQRRGLEAPKLVSELRGDLDWIVMKALEKDRARRYETANGLAMDIQRHLNNEPVVARPPSKLYRLQKTVRRNELAFSAATAVAVALMVGLIVSVWQAQRAKAERDSAEAILNFFRENILAAGRPEGQNGGLGKDVTLRKAIDAAEGQISEIFQNRPVVEAAIRHTLGESYWYLGELQLGIQQMERALALRRQCLGLKHSDTLQSMNWLGDMYAEVGKVEEAVSLLENALKLAKSHLGSEHQRTFGSINNLIRAYQLARKPEKALAVGEEALELSKAKRGLDNTETLRLMNSLTLAYLDAGKLERAIPLCEELLKLVKAKLSPEHPHCVVVMHNLALAFGDAGKWDEAMRLSEQVFKSQKLKLGSPHPQTLTARRQLARAYQQTGKFDQAVPLFQESLKLYTEVRGPDHPETLKTGRDLGKTLILEGAKIKSADPSRSQQLAREGEQLVHEYLARMRRCYSNDPTALSYSLVDVAEVYYRHGNHRKAEPLNREAIEVLRGRVRADQKDMLEATASLARLLSDWAWTERTNAVATEVTRLTSPATTPYERAREAERLLREVLAVRLRDSAKSWRLGEVKSRLGATLVSVAVTDPALEPEGRHSKLGQAESLLLQGYDGLQIAFTDGKYQRDALERLVRLYDALNKPDKRAEWQERLELFDKAQKKPSSSEAPVEGALESKAETK